MISKAFVLAAGLGTRLRPLTETLPKPLVPVGLKPLITFAFDHLIADLGVAEFVANTHHLPGSYDVAFPNAAYRDRPIRFRHEPTLLETGGGIRNVLDLLGTGTTVVYNGDILTDLPLGPAAEYHRAAGNEVTLVLRSSGSPRHVSWDPATSRLLDIRNKLGTGVPAGYGFSGVYFIEPAFVERIPLGQVVSVIPSFLKMIRQGERIGGFLADEGDWRDLGSRGEYLRVHRDLHAQTLAAGTAAPTSPLFPRYGAPDPGWRNWVHPQAEIAPDARVLGASVVGAGARVGAGAVVEDSILWPGAEIASNARLANCIVRTSQRAGGDARDRDF